MRVRLEDGARTTLHVAGYDRRAFEARVVVLERPVPLVRWCGVEGVHDAVVGGFFSRPEYVPLGEVQIDGRSQPSLAFDPPWGDVRACVQITNGELRIARRDQLGAAPAGDLLQAGPMLVAGGEMAVVPGQDPEGFSAGARQFDSDITQGRYPRAALAVARESLLLVACDGRTHRDAGMTLLELARVLAASARALDRMESASLRALASRRADSVLALVSVWLALELAVVTVFSASALAVATERSASSRALVRVLLASARAADRVLPASFRALVSVLSDSALALERVW